MKHTPAQTRGRHTAPTKRTAWIAGLTATAAAVGLSVFAISPSANATDASSVDQGTKPTVVLVHGAWADAAGWTPVAERLQKDGYSVKAPPNPLRGLTSDAQYINSVLKQIKGPIILVGHSYGGAVITNAVQDNPNVKALVYIAAFAPAQGESLSDLNSRPVAHPIAALPTDPTTYLKPDGTEGTELTIDPTQYPNVFLDNELPQVQADALAAEQRPLSVDSATEKSDTPAWKTVPSWYLVANNDRAIAPDLERYMAARAHAQTVQVDAPHLAMVTNPAPVTDLIEQAARATAQ